MNLKFASFLMENKDTIIGALEKISTIQAAEYEFNSSLKALVGFSEERSLYRPKKQNKLVIYHPSNMVLYSYILYALNTYDLFDMIVIRPSVQSKESVQIIHNLFTKNFDLNIDLQIKKQIKFTKENRDADVVIFTGSYSNSVDVRSFFPKSIFFFFGSGINPFIIDKTANLETAVEDCIFSRLFNLGQDCLCPNIFFLHESIANFFTNDLIKRLKSINKEKEEWKLFYKGIAEESKSFLEKVKGQVVYEGDIDCEKNIVTPTVVVSNIKEFIEPIEFFSPVFYFVTYSNVNDIVELLNQESWTKRALGLTYYGYRSGQNLFSDSFFISLNQTLFHAEDGNKPFGGKGLYSNYIYFNEKIFSGPILISKDIEKLLTKSYKEDNVYV